MKFFFFLVLCLVALSAIEAKRNRFERVKAGVRGDPCDIMCPKRDGWDRCEIVKERGETSVRCIDNRPDGPPFRGGAPPPPPYRG